MNWGIGGKALATADIRAMAGASGSRVKVGKRRCCGLASDVFGWATKRTSPRDTMHRFSIRALMVLIVVLTFDAFERIGHAIFALLLGLLGGTVAVWFYARREPATAAGGETPV